MIKKAFKQFRDALVIGQVRRAKLPDFPQDRSCRVKIRFCGRVQKVGFRLEVCELAKRLGLTGWCANLPDGSVLAELQGPGNRIGFLVSFMESLKRIRITEKTVQPLPVCPGETEFLRK